MNQQNFTIEKNERLNTMYSRIVLKPSTSPWGAECKPGQFVQIAIDVPGVFLRRPISVNDYNAVSGTLTILVRKAGKGTEALINMPEGTGLNIVGPLGNGFDLNLGGGKRPLLIGGGVGVAPLLYLGRKLKEAGAEPQFLLGARSAADVLELDEFKAIGKVHVSTEDGSMGEKGLVTQHSTLDEVHDAYLVCGPAPMMKALAKVARKKGVSCEVSLENMMACGLGACLCCVEKTVKGNVCVCTNGPVFNINELTWE